MLYVICRNIFYQWIIEFLSKIFAAKSVFDGYIVQNHLLLARYGNKCIHPIHDGRYIFIIEFQKIK